MKSKHTDSQQMLLDLHRHLLCEDIQRPSQGSARPRHGRTISPSHRPPIHSRQVQLSSGFSGKADRSSESPRYLCLKNKPTEAWKVIRRIHHDPEDASDSAAHAELVQITRQVDFDKEQKAGYIEMFRKPSWRKRSLLTIFIQSVSSPSE